MSKRSDGADKQISSSQAGGFAVKQPYGTEMDNGANNALQEEPKTSPSIDL